MKNGNSSTNENEHRTEYSSDQTEDYSMEDDSSIGDSADHGVESSEYEGDHSDNSSFSSASESSTTENPMTENADDGYITLEEAIRTIIGVDPVPPEPLNAARPPNDDDMINYLKYVIWHYQMTIWQQHQAAVARAAPFMHVQPVNVGHGVNPVVANAGMRPTQTSPAVSPNSGTGTFSGVLPAGMMPLTAVPPPGTGTLFGVPPAGMQAITGNLSAVPPAGMPAVTGNLSSVPPAGMQAVTRNLSSAPPAAIGGNGGIVPISEPSNVVPPGNDGIVLVPESSSAPAVPGNDGVVPTEGNNGKA